MASFIQTHRKAVGIVSVIVALAIAVLYLFVVPEQAASATGLEKFIIEYAHAAVWFLLAAALVLWTLRRGNRARSILAYAALALYAVFLFVTFV